MPSAGTDVAYLGAHQAGFAKKPKPLQHFGPASKILKTASKRAEHKDHLASSGTKVHEVAHILTNIKDHPLPASISPDAAPGREKTSYSQNHNIATFAPTFEVKMKQAQVRSMQSKSNMVSTHHIPVPNDVSVPEMGTNMVFEGASAVGLIACKNSNQLFFLIFLLLSREFYD